VYLNKVTWSLLKASKQQANTQLIETVWLEETVMPIEEAFDWIYTGKERSALEEVRYARSAYEHFVQKDREFRDFK
jgi:hypothetical protein